jgi:hypothetical protein
MLVLHIGFLYLNIYQWPLQRIQAQMYTYGSIVFQEGQLVPELPGSLALKEVTLSINNSGVEAIYKYTFYFGLGLTIFTMIVILFFLTKRYAYPQKYQDA